MFLFYLLKFTNRTKEIGTESVLWRRSRIWSSLYILKQRVSCRCYTEGDDAIIHVN